MVNIKTTEPTLKEIVRQLLAAGKPDKIILFGSTARGQSTTESDYDLLVIENTAQPRHLRAAPYRRALKSLGHPKDIVVWTMREISEWQNVPNAFITTAVREGRILYER